MARVVRFHQVGGPEVLRVEEVEVPPPGKGEVQINIKALGLNRAESMFRRGQYLEQPKLPARLGYEAAGTVAAVGPEVREFKIGDAVSTIPSFSLNDYGLYGDLANAPVHAVTQHPASLSWTEAAAVWMQYLTAYGALIDIGKLTKGDTILIPAASSSVGLAAIQIAKRVGAVPVALKRGKSKRGLGREGGKGGGAVVRTCWWPTISEAGEGGRAMGDTVPLRGAHPGADAASVVRRAGQVAHNSRIRDAGDHERSAASGTGEEVRERRAGRGQPQAAHRRDVSAR